MDNLGTFKIVQDLARELSSGTVDLPGFPSVFAQVCQALNDPTMTTDQVAKIVGAEPALAARLLTLANSASNSPNSKPISELKSAVTRLGNNSIRAAASAFAINQIKRQAALASVQSGLEDLWKKSTFLAAICHVIGRHARVSPDEALLTGLMHAMGALYLLVRSVDYPVIAASPGAFTDLSREWNAQITKSILENWYFPDSIVQAAGDQDDVERTHSGAADLTDIIVCSKTLVDCGSYRDRIDSAYREVPALAKVGLTVAQYQQVIQHAQLQIDVLHEVLKPT